MDINADPSTGSRATAEKMVNTHGKVKAKLMAAEMRKDSSGTKRIYWSKVILHIRESI